MTAENTLESRTGILYRDVLFEPAVVYEEIIGTTKKLYPFDKSLKRLQQAGFDRHPRPQEVFSLLIASLEGKLTPEQIEVADNMHASYGEWFSLAALRKGNELLLYYDPKNLILNGNRYEVQGQLRHAREQKFSIRDLPSLKYMSIQEVNEKCPQLVQALWTRPFKDLPQQIKNKNTAGLSLPPDGQIWPVGLGGYWFCVTGYSASRGVVVQKQNKEQNLKL